MADVLGVAGCGRMGYGMLRNLQAAGFEAHGFDIRPEAGVGTDLASFCDGLTTLFSVVRDTDETDALLFDTQAVVHQCPTLTRVVICSTLSPRYIARLCHRLPAHITLIDAPMSGAKVRADAGTLSFMVGGEVAPILPYLQAMGDAIHPMGALGAGMTAKVLNNLLAASHTAMTRLVLDWADAQGVAEDKLLALINTSSGQNWFASGFEEIEFTRDGYATDNSIGILVKDVAAALDIAPDDNTALPEIVQQTIRNLTPRTRK